MRFLEGISYFLLLQPGFRITRDDEKLTENVEEYCDLNIRFSAMILLISRLQYLFSNGRWIGSREVV